MMIKSAQLETLEILITQLVDGPSSQHEIISIQLILPTTPPPAIHAAAVSNRS